MACRWSCLSHACRRWVSRSTTSNCGARRHESDLGFRCNAPVSKTPATESASTITATSPASSTNGCSASCSPAPIRLAFLSERPQQYPAWNMDWDDQRRAPRAYVDGHARLRIVEQGPARVALRILRKTEGSRFGETIRLAAGSGGDRIEFLSAIDWATSAVALKAVFPLTAANAQATYNLGLGTILRGNDDPKQYEVPGHQWFDLTDRSGDFGVTILSGDKYGSDKPDDRTLRLTLLYTPAAHGFADQATQDWGHHEISYGLTAHAGDFRHEQTDWQAERLNAPLMAFTSAQHDGPLGRSLSLLQLDSTRIKITALKQAEQGDELIVRLLELDGRSQPHVTIRFASSVLSMRELDAQERPLEEAARRDPEPPRSRRRAAGRLRPLSAAHLCSAARRGRGPHWPAPPAFRSDSTTIGRSPHGVASSERLRCRTRGTAVRAAAASVSYQGIRFVLGLRTGLDACMRARPTHRAAGVRLQSSVPARRRRRS